MATQPEVPWWSVLVATILTAAVSVLATVYALRGGPKPGVPSVPSVGSFFVDTITYIPHILLLFGVLADMFTYQGVYSIPSLVGLLSIPLNYVFKYFWIGIFQTVGKIGDIIASVPAATASATSTPRVGGSDFGFAGQPLPSIRSAPTSSFFKNYDGCNVQGFAWAASPYAPQTLVVTATVFSYYMFDLIMNRGWLNATATIVGFATLFVAEMFVIGDCPTDGDVKLSKYLRGAMALAEGMLFGGSAYGITQAFYSNRLPSSAIYPFPHTNIRDLKKNAQGVWVDKDGKPYKQLPNGQAVPNLEDKDGQDAWKDILGGAGASGTGSAATAGSCKT
jgi:hypothetical protein